MRKTFPDGKGGNIRVYQSESIGLMRDNTTEKESMWWLIQPGKSNINLWLPSNHIAYAVLKALGLYNAKLDEEAVVGDASMSKEEQLQINEEEAKKHNWDKITPRFDEKTSSKDRYTVYTCEKCGESFKHFYNQEPKDLNELKLSLNITDYCKTADGEK